MAENGFRHWSECVKEGNYMSSCAIDTPYLSSAGCFPYVPCRVLNMKWNLHAGNWLKGPVNGTDGGETLVILGRDRVVLI